MDTGLQVRRVRSMVTIGLLFAMFAPLSTISLHAVQAPPDGRAMGEQPWPMLARSLVGVQVACPIGASECARYRELLVLSDAQRMFFDGLHEQYLDRCQALEVERAPKMLEMAEEFQVSLGQRTRDRVFVNANSRWLSMEADFNKRIASLDEQLFAQLEVALSEEQETAMPRVRMHRDRSRVMPPRWFGTPKSVIDLSAMIDELAIIGDPTEQLDSVRWSYEQAFTPVLIKATSLHLANREGIETARFRQRFDEQGTALDRTVPGVMDRLREIGAQINEMYAAQGREQLRLAAMNDEYLIMLANAMPASEAEKLQATYRHFVYWRVFPDHADPQDLVAGMIGHPAISAELNAVIRGHWDAYRSKYDELNAALVRESDAWDLGHALTAASNGWKRHIAAMTELASKRLVLNEAIVQTIVPLLPGEVSEHRRIAISDWREIVASDRQTINEPAWQAYSQR